MAPEESDRPEFVSSKLFAPVDPRPLDGAAWWEVAADYDVDRGTIAALLCPDCAGMLKRWLYLGHALPGRPAAAEVIS